MRFRSFLSITILFIIISAIVGIYFSGIFPVMNVFALDDGFINPARYGFYIAGLIFLLFLMSGILPKIDPLKPDFSTFSNEYYLMIFSSELFVFYFFILDIFRANGFKIDVVSWLSLGFAILFWFTAGFLLKVQRSWFFGVRTPWTFKSDEVFNRTNKLGGRLLKIVAGFSLIGFLLGDSCLYFSVFPFVLVFVFLFFYSYVIYQNQ